MAVEILGQAAALATIQESPLFLSPVHAGVSSPADDLVETQLDLNQYLVSHPVASCSPCLRGFHGGSRHL